MRKNFAVYTRSYHQSDLPTSIREICFFQPLLCRAEILKNSFLPYTINEWNKVDPEIRKIDSYVGFRKKITKFY